MELLMEFFFSCRFEIVLFSKCEIDTDARFMGPFHG